MNSFLQRNKLLVDLFVFIIGLLILWHKSEVHQKELNHPSQTIENISGS